MPQFSVCLQILHPLNPSLYPHPTKSHPTAPGLSFAAEKVKTFLATLDSWVLKNSSYTSSLCRFRPIICLKSSSISLEIGKHHCIKKVQKVVSLTTGPSAYFLFSQGLISDHQFAFRQGYSTLDMLLQLSQQWMEAHNVRNEIRAVTGHISNCQ